jgi:hypothetical protein
LLRFTALCFGSSAARDQRAVGRHVLYRLRSAIAIVLRPLPSRLGFGGCYLCLHQLLQRCCCLRRFHSAAARVPFAPRSALSVWRPPELASIVLRSAGSMCHLPARSVAVAREPHFVRSPDGCGRSVMVRAILFYLPQGDSALVWLRRRGRRWRRCVFCLCSARHYFIG